MIILRQAGPSAGFGDPGVDITAPVVLAVLHVLDIH
jgi:hypothetical protein